MRDVIVLHAELAGQAAPDREQALFERLPYAHRLDVARREPAARAASLRALCLLAAGVLRLRGMPLDPAQLRFSDEGKPSLVGGPEFSISHSPRRVVVALCEGQALGVDVEELGAHGRSRAELVRWTAVEAALKSVGAGLRQSRQVRLAADLSVAELGTTVLRLCPVALSADCVAMLASSEPVGRLVVEESGRMADTA